MDPSAKKVFSAWLKIKRSPNPQAAITTERWRYVFLLVAMIIVSGGLASIVPGEAMLAAGVGIGIVLGTIASIEQRLSSLRKNWPVLEEVIDWEKLEDKLKEDA